LGGEHSVDEEEVLADEVESVTCRWCGKSSSIEVTAETAAVDSAPKGPRAETTAPV
jgi:hypothetical protein